MTSLTQKLHYGIDIHLKNALKHIVTECMSFPNSVNS